VQLYGGSCGEGR